ncbi:MAG: ABC transporter substrate-binding protein [Rhodocyclaceae bacterium]
MNRRRFLGHATAAVALPALTFRTDIALAQARAEYVIGQSVDLSGPAQNMGRDYFTGAKLAFDQTTDKARRYRLVQLDDGGDPARTAANIDTLLRETRANILFGFTGDASVEAVARHRGFAQSNALLFAPMSGAHQYADNPRMVFLRATYAEEIATLLGRFARLGLTSLAIAHAENGAGPIARDAALALLRERKAPTPARFVLGRDGNDAVAVAGRIAQARPQAVVILADTVSASVLAREVVPRCPGTFVCVTSTTDIGSLQQIVGPRHAVGIVVSRVVPDVRDTAPVVREFARAQAKLFDETPSCAALEGYLAARTLIAALQRGWGATAQDDARRLRSLDLGGWTADFSAGNRTTHYVDTSVISKTGTLVG